MRAYRPLQYAIGSQELSSSLPSVHRRIGSCKYRPPTARPGNKWAETGLETAKPREFVAAAHRRKYRRLIKYFPSLSVLPVPEHLLRRCFAQGQSTEDRSKDENNSRDSSLNKSAVKVGQCPSRWPDETADKTTARLKKLDDESRDPRPVRSPIKLNFHMTRKPRIFVQNRKPPLKNSDSEFKPSPAPHLCEYDALTKQSGVANEPKDVFLGKRCIRITSGIFRSPLGSVKNINPLLENVDKFKPPPAPHLRELDAPEAKFYDGFGAEWLESDWYDSIASWAGAAPRIDKTPETTGEDAPLRVEKKKPCVLKDEPPAVDVRRVGATRGEKHVVRKIMIVNDIKFRPPAPRQMRPWRAKTKGKLRKVSKDGGATDLDDMCDDANQQRRQETKDHKMVRRVEVLPSPDQAPSEPSQIIDTGHGSFRMWKMPIRVPPLRLAQSTHVSSQQFQPDEAPNHKYPETSTPVISRILNPYSCFPNLDLVPPPEGSFCIERKAIAKECMLMLETSIEQMGSQQVQDLKAAYLTLADPLRRAAYLFKHAVPRARMDVDRLRRQYPNMFDPYLAEFRQTLERERELRRHEWEAVQRERGIELEQALGDAMRKKQWELVKASYARLWCFLTVGRTYGVNEQPLGKRMRLGFVDPAEEERLPLGRILHLHYHQDE